MHPSPVVYRMYRTCFALLFFCLLCTLLPPASQAQITLDGSLGPRGALIGPNYSITDSVGQIRGRNLFHSFGQFNLLRGETATFTGPDTIANILSRVTGGSPSSIDGTIRSQISGANLFLLNPSGVLFGPNASLAVSGSFHVSTANVLRFSDGATFSAHLTDKSTLTFSSPVAFGFLDSNPSGMVIQGSRLQVQQGKTFSVTGGDITMTASQLGAPSGRLALTSVASPGDVQVEAVQGASRLSENMPARLGTVRADGAQLNVNGTPGGTLLVEAGALTLTNRAMIRNQTSGVLPGGDILVRAQTVTMREGSFISSVTQGAGRGGHVTVTADVLMMDGSPGLPGQNPIISAISGPGSAGDAGSVQVEARTVTLTNGAQIQSGTLGTGHGGNVTIRARDAVTVDGFGIGLTAQGPQAVPSGILASSQLGSAGDAGSVQVEARTVTLTNGGQIQSGTAGTGHGGNVTVSVRDAVTLDGFGGGLLSLITTSSLPEATGDAGSVRVEAQTVTATNGAQISSATFGAGQGGSVTVMARERVTFRGTSPEGEELLGRLVPGDRTFPSGALANSHSTGTPGIVQVTAPEVMLDAGGRISSLNIASESAGGTVIVQAPDTLKIAGVGSSLRTRTFGPGRGGDIEVNAGAVSLTAGADLSAASMKTDDATASGNAGNVTVTVGKNMLIQNSSVTTEASQAAGGNITLQVQDMLRLRNSKVTATVGGGRETVGGNITIDPQFVILEGSQIVANANEGQGGNIRIQAQRAFLADPASIVDASSALGINGFVNIQAPVNSISGAIAPLQQEFAPITELLRDRCAGRLREGRVSRFLLGGRDGIPSEPGSLLLSPLMQTDPREDGEPAGTPARTGQVQERAWPVRAGMLAGLDVECARWTGHKGPTVGKKP